MTKEEIRDFINIYYKYTANINNKYENAYEDDLLFWHNMFRLKPSSFPMETYPEMYRSPNVRIVNG